ncbi:MAG: rhamnulokinase family protein [Phycisphaerae bacterium]
MKKAYLAFDLGAESGRAMLGVLDGGKLEFHELHRFANIPRRLPSGLHWNLLDLWGNLLEGLRKAASHCRDNGLELASLGVDTWGVDYGLLGKSGELLALPHAYRDERNIAASEKAIAKLGRERIYRETGIQFMAFNTLFQLAAANEAEPGLLERAKRLAMVPDLLHYFLSGEAICEATDASTTQMIDPRGGPTGAWARGLLADLGLPDGMLGEITPAGTCIGRLREAVAQETGAGGVKVIAPASHDTASAIAAVPADDRTSWCYLSSGTWSLMGVELPGPLINDAAMAANFTNERGLAGTVRFLRNIPGLWMVQQVRQDLSQRAGGGTNLDYASLAAAAAKAAPFRTLVDPNHAPFGQPGGMIGKIAAFAAATGQVRPGDVGALVRCCLESLALEYRRTLDALEAVVGRRIDVIHIVGGGGRNELLNQMTADATGRTVIAGPHEATAAGNALVQAMGDGLVASPVEIRRVVRQSFSPRTFQPSDTAAWDKAWDRYAGLILTPPRRGLD